MDPSSAGGKKQTSSPLDSTSSDESHLSRIARRLSAPHAFKDRKPEVKFRDVTQSVPLHLHLCDVKSGDKNLNNNQLENSCEQFNGSDKGFPHEDVYTVNYPRAIELLGPPGKFHTYLALSCGFLFLASALQNNLNAFILPSVRCDLQISSMQMGYINAVFLIGGISSNFMWGVVADMLGRRAVVVYGMFLDGLLTLVSSLSQHFEVLLVFRFLNGFIVGGPSSLVLAYMGEFFPDKLRAKVICYVGVFWTLSWVIMPVVGWAVIPVKWSLDGEGFVFNSWRMLVAIMALPSLLSALLLMRFPESPRFLLVKGKDQEALNILNTIYSMNNQKCLEKYPVKSLRPHLTQKDTSEDTDSKSVWRPFKLLYRQVQPLFTSNVVLITALTCSMFFSNMFGYYGLGMWMPELFNKMSSHLDLHPGSQVTVCTATKGLSNNSSMSQIACDPTDVDNSVFVQTIIMGVVGLLGNWVSGLLANRLKRRTLPVVLMGLSGLCVVFIHYISIVSLNIIIASVFTLTIGTANLVYNSLVVDMFPPDVSGMGVCMAILIGRVGAMISNLVFGYLLDINCSIPIFLVAAVLFAGSAVSFFIPNEPYTDRITSASKEEINQEIFAIT